MFKFVAAVILASFAFNLVPAHVAKADDSSGKIVVVVKVPGDQQTGEGGRR